MCLEADGGCDSNATKIGIQRERDTLDACVGKILKSRKRTVCDSDLQMYFHSKSIKLVIIVSSCFECQNWAVYTIRFTCICIKGNPLLLMLYCLIICPVSWHGFNSLSIAVCSLKETTWHSLKEAAWWVLRWIAL